METKRAGARRKVGRILTRATRAAAAILLLAHAAGAQTLLPTRAPRDFRYDRAQLGLRGPVRSVKEDSFYLRGGGVEVFAGNSTLHFDEQGRLTRLLRGNDEVEDVFAETYTHRGDGRVAEKLHHNAGERGGREVYVYDDARRSVEVSLYARDGLLGMREVNFYDARGLETRREMEMMDAGAPGRPLKPAGTVTFAYDEKGEPSGVTATHPDMKPYSYGLSQERDAAGRRTVTVTAEAPRDPAALGPNNEPPARRPVKIVYQFDRDDQPLAVEHYAAGGRLLERTTYTRKLDPHGNWTEELIETRESGRAGLWPKQTTKRTRKIIYYGRPGPASAGARRTHRQS